nr:MAG TPA: hypothetical protein [Caudoviricetes sp.]
MEKNPHVDNLYLPNLPVNIKRTKNTPSCSSSFLP